MIGVGAAFNFYSGIERRAPPWVVRMHLEFAYRILQNPKKQFTRCMGIITSLPRMLIGEWKRKNKVVVAQVPPLLIFLRNHTRIHIHTDDSTGVFACLGQCH